MKYIHNARYAVYTHKLWLLTMTFIFLLRVSPSCRNPGGLMLMSVLDCYFTSHIQTPNSIHFFSEVFTPTINIALVHIFSWPDYCHWLSAE